MLENFLAVKHSVCIIPRLPVKILDKFKISYLFIGFLTISRLNLSLKTIKKIPHRMFSIAVSGNIQCYLCFYRLLR